MPRTKKTDDVASEATPAEAVTVAKDIDVPSKPTAADFKQAVIELGVKMCDDIKAGVLRQDESNIKAITSLYESIKD